MPSGSTALHTIPANNSRYKKGHAVTNDKRDAAAVQSFKSREKQKHLFWYLLNPNFLVFNFLPFFPFFLPVSREAHCLNACIWQSFSVVLQCFWRDGFGGITARIFETIF